MEEVSFHIYHELNVYLWDEPMKWQGDTIRMGR